MYIYSWEILSFTLLTCAGNSIFWTQLFQTLLENENNIINPATVVNPIGKRGVKPRRKSNLHRMNNLCSRFLLITDPIIVLARKLR